MDKINWDINPIFPRFVNENAPTMEMWKFFIIFASVF